MKSALVILVMVLTLIVGLTACSSAPATTSAPTAVTTTATTSATAPTTAVSTTPSTTSKPSSTTTAPSATVSPTQTSTGPKPQVGGILRVVRPTAPASFGYPPEIFAGSTVAAIPCLETLVGWMDSTGKYQPKLATGWQFGPDNAYVTFNLRKGVKFQDGTDFNAQAVKWNLDASKGTNTSGTEVMASIDVIDDYTVRINLKGFKNSMFSNLAGSAGMMTSPTAVQKNGIAWARFNPVGAGPFKFQEYKQDTSLRYVRYDDYWGGKSYLDTMQFDYIADPLTQTAAFQADYEDVLYEPDITVAAKLISMGYVKSNSLDVPWIMAGDGANADSPFANQKVRQAVEYALDKNALAKLGSGYWDAISTIVPSSSYAYDPKTMQGRAYDATKAKQLLSEAGYPNGFQTRLIASTASPVIGEDALVAIQRYLKNVGIDAKIEMVPLTKYTEYRTAGWKNGLMTFTANPNPTLSYGADRFLTAGGASAYKSLFQPDGWAAKVKAALEASDTDTMIKIERELILTALDQASVIPLWSYERFNVLNSRVHDANFFTNGAQFQWTPGITWISK